MLSMHLMETDEVYIEGYPEDFVRLSKLIKDPALDALRARLDLHQDDLAQEAHAAAAEDYEESIRNPNKKEWEEPPQETRMVRVFNDELEATRELLTHPKAPKGAKSLSTKLYKTI